MFKKLLDNTKAGSLANKFRKKRHRLFKEFIKDVTLPVKILDLGGTENYWHNVGLAETNEYLITIINITEPEFPQKNNLRFIKGDACNLSQFSDNSFDVVFSNSVIEHIKDSSMRRKMSEEAVRVSKMYFIQTPNYYFPFEPHFLFPCFQFLPKWLKIYMLTHFNMGWFKKCGNKKEADELLECNRLLTAGELKSYFKDCKILKERFIFLNKSLIAVGKNS
ncbi:MAG: class I SAM-dependent methyltransferase [Ignavibacteria bacterium]|nr:class I SAM-dependent methyltransferase [Ignavibacteria bacterium]